MIKNCLSSSLQLQVIIQSNDDCKTLKRFMNDIFSSSRWQIFNIEYVSCNFSITLLSLAWVFQYSLFSIYTKLDWMLLVAWNRRVLKRVLWQFITKLQITTKFLVIPSNISKNECAISSPCIRVCHLNLSLTN